MVRLIEQLQYDTKGTATGSYKLNLNHPVKELIWTDAASITTQKAQIQLNGHDRFSARDSKYFTRCQVWQHHTGFGGVTVQDSIAVYSFALKPEEHQPSGTCNFSRIDNAQLVQGTGGTTDSLNIYAVNYNVLRIMSGMGGLAYSN